MNSWSTRHYWHAYGPPNSTTGLVIWLAGLVCYFLPGIIASRRGHRNAMAIWALDFLLGWSVIGWVAAFVWALTDNTSSKR